MTKKEKPPTCPDCGSPEVLAPGIEWYCDNKQCVTQTDAYKRTDADRFIAAFKQPEKVVTTITIDSDVLRRAVSETIKHACNAGSDLTSTYKGGMARLQKKLITNFYNLIAEMNKEGNP